MAGTAVVATGYGGRGPLDVPSVAAAVRDLMAADWDVVVVAPEEGFARALALALGLTRADRRAVPVAIHVVVDPADPAFALPPDLCAPDPLGVLEAEAVTALLERGFPVVATGAHPVVPSGRSFGPVEAVLDEAAAAQRLAGDIGASALVFVLDDEVSALAAGPAGEIDVDEAERRLAEGSSALGPELRAAARFVRAGGELAAITTPAGLATALDGTPARIATPIDGPPAGGSRLHIHRRVARPRSDTPALAAGWC